MVIFRGRDVIDKTIAIIGAGSLGTQVIDALYQRGHRKIIASRRNEGALAQLRETYQIMVTTNNIVAAQQSDVLILSVKPYMLETVSREVPDYAKGKLVISLAAGKGIAEIESILDAARVARVMTGVFVAEEISAYTIGTRGSMAERDNDREMIRYIFGSTAREVEEHLLADRTWIACDTGLIAKALDVKINALLRSGLEEKDARAFYAATLRAIAIHLEAGMSGNVIYRAVAGPKSFTEGLHHFLEEHGHYSLLEQCVERTVKACRGK